MANKRNNKKAIKVKLNNVSKEKMDAFIEGLVKTGDLLFRWYEMKEGDEFELNSRQHLHLGCISTTGKFSGGYLELLCEHSFSTVLEYLKNTNQFTAALTIFWDCFKDPVTIVIEECGCYEVNNYQYSNSIKLTRPGLEVA